MKEEEKEKDKDLGLSMDEEAMLELFLESDGARRGVGEPIEIDGKEWRVKRLTMSQEVKRLNLDVDILYWQRKLKDAKAACAAKRLNAKIRKAYAKKAAWRLVGKWARWIPGYFWLTWRRVYNASEKVSATLNTDAIVGGEKDFFLANLGSSKRALALSMSLVGESVRARQERGESAGSMLAKDALPKKEGEGK